MPSLSTVLTPPQEARDLRIEHFDGAAVAADLEPWVTAYERVYADSLDLDDHCDPPISDRLLRHSARPGFALVAAMDGDEVAGFLYGYTLPTDSLWWEGLISDLGPEFTCEYPGRTVGMCEVLVSAAWRRSRIAHVLFEAFVAERHEERAAGFVAADNDVMLATYAKYGFEVVGRMEPYEGWRPHVAIVRQLTRA
ncbi:GNAT family N-acetyltransferase [Streptomyces sp. E11-3]|uniref:GNAT family N-acetyltransferase n=1 Tax=Streptomyces sp. E11-3 TaxID=3110112 RepID=UPI003980331A